MEAGKQQIQSYVWAKDKCFFVLTIERESSATDGPKRFNETTVWAYDWEKKETGELLYHDGDPCRSIKSHLEICWLLYKGHPFPND